MQPEAARPAPSANAHPYSYVSDAFVAKTKTDLTVVLNCILMGKFAMPHTTFVSLTHCTCDVMCDV